MTVSDKNLKKINCTVFELYIFLSGLFFCYPDGVWQLLPDASLEATESDRVATEAANAAISADDYAIIVH